MSIQYLSDEKGHVTAVQVPIDEWELLRKRYPEIDQTSDEIPEWHKEIVRERLRNYEKYPEQVLDFDATMDDIEKEL